MDSDLQPVMAPARAGRGRPAKMNAAMIVAKAREMLLEKQPEEISFTQLARELRVPSSSVYNYFPNREVLLSAVALDVFAGFHFDDPGATVPWQQRLRAWLEEIDRFFDRNPVAFRVMATNSQASFAWINVRAPLLEVLSGLGYSGRELTVVHAWFEGQVTGMLLIEYHSAINRAIAADVDRDPASAANEAERCDIERRHYLPTIKREEIVTMGFDGLICALEHMAGDRAHRA
jgi:AcrR family transcriptional regulator